MTATIARDPMLRRLERNACLWCAGAAGVAFGVSGGPAAAFAVLGGGGLIAFSYWAIVSSIDTLVAAVERRRQTLTRADYRSIALAMLKLAGRYALLGLLAYVMIARLRMHPIGLLVGASSMVAAVAIEAVRIQLRKSGS
jgi:hypothetical protein